MTNLLTSLTEYKINRSAECTMSTIVTTWRSIVVDFAASSRCVKFVFIVFLCTSLNFVLNKRNERLVRFFILSFSVFHLCFALNGDEMRFARMANYHRVLVHTHMYGISTGTSTGTRKGTEDRERQADA